MGTETQIFNYISQLLLQSGGQFASIGQAMFTGFATIMIVWFGVKSALTAGEVVGGFHFGKFAEFLLLIAFGYAMINYYNTPIPGFGAELPAACHQPIEVSDHPDRRHRAPKGSDRHHQLQPNHSISQPRQHQRDLRVRGGRDHPGGLEIRLDRCQSFGPRRYRRCCPLRPPLHPLLYRP